MDGLWRVDSEYSAEKTEMFTICSLIFGEFLLFNGNVYKTNERLNPDIERGKIAVIMDNIKLKAAGIFAFIKNLALGLTFPMLVYALVKLLSTDSTSALNVAKWKKVLGSWVLCLILLYFVQYLITFLNNLNDTVMDILWTMRTNLENNGQESFELALFTSSVSEFTKTGGLLSAGYGIEYLGLVIIQIIFFVKYGFRTFGLIFLTVIAPIVVVVDAFNVMRGKDQNSTLADWGKTYFSLLFMQPMHAALYLLFMFTASAIAINAPLLGLVFLYALSRAEKITKLMLNLQ